MLLAAQDMTLNDIKTGYRNTPIKKAKDAATGSVGLRESLRNKHSIKNTPKENVKIISLAIHCFVVNLGGLVKNSMIAKAITPVIEPPIMRAIIVTL